jgi:hypothetical protein
VRQAHQIFERSGHHRTTQQNPTWRLVAIRRIGPDVKVTEHWSSLDRFGLLRQLGALLTSETARAGRGRGGHRTKARD